MVCGISTKSLVWAKLVRTKSTFRLDARGLTEGKGLPMPNQKIKLKGPTRVQVLQMARDRCSRSEESSLILAIAAGARLRGTGFGLNEPHEVRVRTEPNSFREVQTETGFAEFLQQNLQQKNLIADFGFPIDNWMIKHHNKWAHSDLCYGAPLLQYTSMVSL